MFIGSARPMEDAARIAYRELVRWVAAETGQSEADAYMLLTMCGKVRLGNMVDPKYSLAAGIEKKYLIPKATASDSFGISGIPDAPSI